METHVLTPQQIFYQPQQLVVPPFQRPYVWEEEEQWAPFWLDTRAVAERTLAGMQSPLRHFLGAIVLQARDCCTIR
ncbi:GmrSD restriction endonuclease domain-containing protein [Dermacoccus abyssi]